jgi:indolepyruvate ferredoxin oxidoreductase beta subunit
MDKFDNISNNNNNYKRDGSPASAKAQADAQCGAYAKAKAVSRKYDKSLKEGDTVSVLFAGVGGQGIILSSRVLAHTVINAGFDVKVSEVHGMAQRGGSVEGSVRFGKKVYSPTIGGADFIIALEKLEALRYTPRLESKGTIIINDYEIYPSTLHAKDSSYPEKIEKKIKKITPNSYFISAVDIARSLGEIRAANIIMLGLLSNFLPVDYDCWIESIEKNVKQKAVKLNIEAFIKGREECL